MQCYRKSYDIETAIYKRVQLIISEFYCLQKRGTSRLLCKKHSITVSAQMFSVYNYLKSNEEMKGVDNELL